MTARPVGDGDGQDGLRRLLAEAVARRIYAEGPDGEVDPTALVDELEPVVTAWAEQRARERAAEELRAAADAYCGDGLSGRALHALFAARAERLAADDRTGQRLPRPAPLEWVTCGDLLTPCTHDGPHVPVGLDGRPTDRTGQR